MNREYKLGSGAEKIIYQKKHSHLNVHGVQGKIVFKLKEWDAVIRCIRKLEDLIQARLQGKVFYEGVVEQNVYLDVERKRCLTIGKSSSHVFFSLRSYEKEGKITASQVALTTCTARHFKKAALKIQICIGKEKFETLLAKYRKALRNSDEKERKTTCKAIEAQIEDENNEWNKEVEKEEEEARDVANN